MIDLKTLKQLIRLMADQDLTEMDLEDEKGEKVRLRRRGGVPEVQYVTAQPQPTMATGQAHGGSASGGASASVVPAAASGGGGGGAPASAGASGGASTAPTIKSPMVGTYYASPTPDAKPFVAAGDRVDADTVVCIIEAMKVFNEIKAEVAGTIERVLVENGQSVEFGQPMFQVKPD